MKEQHKSELRKALEPSDRNQRAVRNERKSDFKEKAIWEEH
jgi:hypothetical protein